MCQPFLLECMVLPAVSETSCRSTLPKRYRAMALADIQSTWLLALEAAIGPVFIARYFKNTRRPLR